MITFNLPLLILGIALLWIPRQWLRRGLAFASRRRSKKNVEPWHTREPGDPGVNFRTEFTKFRNYIDLLRAMAGGLVLMGGMGLTAAIAAQPGMERAANPQLIGIRIGVLLVGLLLQTLRRERGHLSFYPPIFYLAGISVALCDPRGAAFAFILIWAINPGLPSAQGFLAVYAVLLGLFGTLFAGRGVMPVAAALLALLPVLLSLMARKPLTIMARRGTHLPGPT